MVIYDQERVGVLPGLIRTNTETTMNSDIFFNIWCKARFSTNAESIKSFLDEISQTYDYDIIVHKKGDILASVSLFNKIVVLKSYCNDISIIDDTYGTIIYDLSAELL